MDFLRTEDTPFHRVDTTMVENNRPKVGDLNVPQKPARYSDTSPYLIDSLFRFATDLHLHNGQRQAWGIFIVNDKITTPRLIAQMVALREDVAALVTVKNVKRISRQV
ncbi:MAG: hypothetical protein M1298_04460 [Chloroflexi bacterium]|nr:hypothetical protein [Chloroflexota bacterium]